MTARQPSKCTPGKSPLTSPDETRIGLTADPWDDLTLRAKASVLADVVELPVVEPLSAGFGQLLTLTADRLEMRQANQVRGRRTKPVYVNLDLLDTTSNAGNRKGQPLGKAVLVAPKNKGQLHVVDATAGLGGDSWLLASMGCSVTAIERCSIIAALLADGLRRADEIKPQIAARVTLITGDARTALLKITSPPDVIYLDPMFPLRRKSALEKKSMRLLRSLVGGDDDAGALFDVAMAVATKRVVVKRPSHGEPLGGTPAVCHKGKSLRYDVYPT